MPGTASGSSTRSGSDVQFFDEHGAWVATFGGEGTGDGQLREPGIASFREDTGELYVADFGNRLVSVFDIAAGSATTAAASTRA